MLIAYSLHSLYIIGITCVVLLLIYMYNYYRWSVFMLISINWKIGLIY